MEHAALAVLFCACNSELEQKEKDRKEEGAGQGQFSRFLPVTAQLSVLQNTTY